MQSGRQCPARADLDRETAQPDVREHQEGWTHGRTVFEPQGHGELALATPAAYFLHCSAEQCSPARQIRYVRQHRVKPMLRVFEEPLDNRLACLQPHIELRKK